MNFHRILSASLLSLALAGSAGSALAAVAVAKAANGYTFTVTEGRNLEETKQEALAGCREREPDCELMVWSDKAGAVAIAKSSGSTAVVLRDTPALARDAAMKACRTRAKDCRFMALYWEPGGEWMAWATAEGADGELLAQFYAYSYGSEAEARQVALNGCAANLKNAAAKCTVTAKWGAWTRVTASSPSYTAYQLEADRAQAEKNALARCREHTPSGQACKIVRAEQNAGPRLKPASFDKVFAQTALAKERAAQSRPSAPPRGRTLSCTNRCVNGSCVRTFANGHTERWEAPRVLDPFTNNWKWDTSSCGG
ncbi:MAG: DUF4189 domain-containing protein [Pseudomonadota bacterium]